MKLLLKILFLLPLTLPCALAQESNGVPEKPNFIVIVADDLGYGDLGCMGSPQIKSPAIDRLAEEGVLCRRAYVTAPVCSPSRMGLLTGKFPGRFGVKSNPNFLWPTTNPELVGLPLGEKTIADILKAKGYATGVMGKWHLGDTDAYFPTKRGFDEFWGFRGGSRSYRHQGNLPKQAQIECTFKEPGQVTHLTYDITRESVEFIKRHKSDPFFLYVAYNAPHVPLDSAKEDLTEFSHIANKKRRNYCGLVKGVDNGVGAIIQTLRETGLSQKTAIVFFSDNGGPVIQGAACNAPLAGQKRTQLEGGVRTPFIISFPGIIKGNKPTDEIISTADILPTFARWAGADIPKNLDGIDLTPVLLKNKPQTPRTLIWQMECIFSVMRGDYKYLLVPDRAPMLFDVRNDPSELKNLYAEKPEIAAELAKEIGKWYSSTPPSLFPDSNTWARQLFREYNYNFERKQPEPDGIPQWTEKE